MKATSELPVDVVVQAGLEVDDLWSRFELFEALHHTMAIANPMASVDLDRVVDLIGPADGSQVLDLACGSGELLRRLGRQASIDGVGVDLSPWMLAAAAGQPDPAFCWVLAEVRSLLEGNSTGQPSVVKADDAARAVVAGRQWDVACCLGASWIWYGLHGTIRALANLVEAGGRVVVGDMHIRPNCDPADALESHGRIDSMEDIDGWFSRYGIEVIERVSTSDESWASYHDRVDRAAATWSKDGNQAQHWIDEASRWRQAAERDRPVLTWSVWVGRKL